LADGDDIAVVQRAPAFHASTSYKNTKSAAFVDNVDGRAGG
jgi:hypothetical protein